MRPARTWLAVVAVAVAVVACFLVVRFALIRGSAKPDRSEAPVAPVREQPPEPRASNKQVEPEKAVAEEAAAAAPERVDLDLGGECRITGRVLAPDGTPLQGARVRADSREAAETDSEGRFACTPGWPGRHVLVVEHPRYARAAMGPFEVRRDQELRGVEIRLAEGGVISGTITDESNEPVGYLDVNLIRTDVERLENAEKLTGFRSILDRREDEPGPYRYTSPPLPPGTYEVSVCAFGRLCDERHIVTVSARQAVEHVDFSLCLGAVVSGRVVDPDGQPVVRANVTLRSDENGPFGWADTDESGAFSIAGLRSGPRTVTVRADDFLLYKGQIESPSDNVRIILDRGCWIVGRVLDRATQEPIEEYVLGIHPQLDPRMLPRQGGIEGGDPTAELGQVFCHEEHPDGRFRHAGFRPWTFTLRVQADGYLPAEIRGVEVKEGVEPQEILVELDRGATVEIVVTDARDGSPVEGAEVIPDDRRSRLIDGVPGFPTTNADGVCVLKPLAPRKHSCDIEHEQYRKTKVSFELAPGEVHKTVGVALEAGLSVRGMVVAQSDGSPIEGASADLRGPRDREAKTDAAGRFSFDVVDPGRYEFVVKAFGFAAHREMIQLERSPESEMRVELGRGGTIAGNVMGADGSPVEGAIAQIRTTILNACWTDDIWTDAQGAYSVSALPPGAYRVAVTVRERGYSEGLLETRRVVVREGEVTRADFVRGGGAAVFGRVTRGDKPVAHTPVRVSLADGALPRTDLAARWARTDEQGAYRIAGLARGRYVLSLGTLGFGFGSAPEGITYDLAIAGADVELNIDLEADVVAGVVRREEGSPCEMAGIELLPLFDEGERITAINSVETRKRSGFATDEKGAFRIAGVAPGRYRLYVSPPTWLAGSQTSVLFEFESEALATAVVEITKETDRDITNLAVTLRNAVDVEGRVSTDDGALPDHVTLMVSDDAGRFLTEGGGPVDPQTGEFPVGRLAPGDYSILANAPGYGLARTTLHVAAEGKTFLNLTFTRAHDLVVTVVDADSRAVAGANVILDLDADALITAETYFSRFYADFDDEEFLASDAAGRKAFRSVGDGAYTLHVRCDGYEDASVPVTIAGRDAEVRVTLRPAAE